MEGRAEPSSGTLRNHLSKLRRALPDGVLVRDGTTYRLTDAVSADLVELRVLLEAEGDRQECLCRALGLVRGPVLSGSLAGRNAPYAWTGDLVYEAERLVEDAAHELAGLALAASHLELGEWAVAQGRKAGPHALVLVEDWLRLGHAEGGGREVARRLARARRDLGDDAGLLEPLARELGAFG